MDLGNIGMMVGGWFASYVGNKLADKVSQHLADRSTADMVEHVKARLPRIQALIQAAERWPIEDPVLATWLRKLKDAAYEADDVLDELEFNELHDKLFKKRKVSHFASSAVKLLQRFIMSDDDLENLKKLVKNFDEIYLDINRKEEQLKDYNTRQRSDSRETCSLIQGRPVGRDEETGMILDLLLHLADEPESSTTCGTGSSSYPSLGVLPIVGIAGVGKTTLAQIIYNDERVARHFELRKWVYVPDDFDVKRISVRLVYDSMYTRSWDDISLDGILGRLKHATMNKRFLFVLDDVWDETGSKWEKLRGALTSGAKGSMVLVTTRSPIVAEVMRTMIPIELKSLQEDDFWELFKRCAFGEKILEEERRKKLQTIGREISKKLDGLPLAGNVLGSLLGCKLDVDFWKRILESEWWEHPYVLENILPSLALSYEHLDANLKQCFAYCSIFPRSYIFEKDRLIQMWMAQGFIQNKNQVRMRMEDIGSEMFDELTRRYFFLPTLNNKYVMHDLMRVLAVHVSLDECLVLDDEKVEIPGTIRHLTLKTDNMDAFMDTCKLQNLRSVFIFGDHDFRKFHNFLDGVLKQSKSLRVLDLSCSQVKLNMLPDSINGFSHLRYLDVSGTMIQQLPESLCELCHLQVLNMQSCYIVELPKDMNKLINLHHLYGPVHAISLIDGIGDLTNLQELELFQIRQMGRHGIGELKGLRNLRGGLSIWHLENVEHKEEAMEAMLKDKEHISALHLENSLWERSHDAEEIFEGLQPHPNLKNLKIKRYGGIRFPNWMVENKFLTHLQSICLESFGKVESIPPLGQLPCLKDLRIATMPSIKRIGPEFYGDTGVAFPSLEFLEFNDFNEWEEWLEADGPQFLPRLRILHLRYCPCLRKVPLLFLSSSLAELRIEYCYGFGSAPPLGCLQRFTSLTTLMIAHYHSQESLRLSNLCALKHLHIEDCPGVKLVGSLRFARSLKHLHIADCQGWNLVRRLQFLSTLETLELAKFPLLIYSSEPVQLNEGQGLRTLYRLHIDSTILFQNLRILLGSLPSLQYLRIHSSHPIITNFTGEHELWFQQLTSLQELEINDCPKLESLPISLVNVSSIRRLIIRNCPDIRSLQENELPTSLEELRIERCPLLKDRCQRGGADWPKIAHIPLVYIDQEFMHHP